MAAASSSYPYIVAAIITAVPATVAASAGWYSAHKGRKENTGDHAKVVAHLQQLDTKVQKVDIRIASMDLRFDSIEDKVERHLGWHRDEATSANRLKEALSKEYQGDEPTYQPVSRPDDIAAES